MNNKKAITYCYVIFNDWKWIKLKKFPNTKEWVVSRNKFIEILERKWAYYRIEDQLSKNQEKELKLATWKKIEKKDIHILLELIVSSLASWLTLSSLTSYLINYNRFIKLHPLIIYLLKQWNSLVDILKLIDFDFKQEILQILSEEHETPENMYKKLKQILHFKNSLDNLRKTLNTLIMKIVFYSAASITLIILLKIKLLPLAKEKLWLFFNDVDKIVETPETLANYVFYIYWFIWIIILFFIILRIFSKKRFNIILLKMPLIKDIMMYWNTLKALIVFSFYYNNIYKLKEKLEELVITPVLWNYKIDLKDNVEDIYLNVLEDLKNKYKIDFFYIIWILWIWKLIEWKEENRQQVIENKVNLYLHEITLIQEKIWTYLNWAILIAIWAAIWIMFMTIFSLWFGWLQMIWNNWWA